MYDVMLGGRSVGEAELTRQGALLQIRCRCRLSGDVVCRVAMYCGEQRWDLGILVPENGAFVLTARLAAKQLGGKKPEFRVEPRRPKLEKDFVPISPEEPFSYLTRLENAYLQVRNGQLGIVLQD